MIFKNFSHGGEHLVVADTEFEAATASNGNINVYIKKHDSPIKSKWFTSDQEVNDYLEYINAQLPSL